jgi:hypothetical protein
MAFLPDELLDALKKKGVASVKSGASFVSSEENARRYGFELPRDLRELFRLADTWAIEDVDLLNYEYLRVTDDGWELPPPDENLLWTVMQRFEWNTFSNMQLWEHLAGLVTIGRDDKDNRWFAGTASDSAPVFWIDHEYGAFTTGEGDERVIVGGCVASSLKTFLRVTVGDNTVRDPEHTLVRKPSHWDEDELDYLDPMTPLRAWPPFLAARSEWIIGAILYQDADSHLDAPAVRCFDAARELPLVSQNEPLALYWLLRTFLLREKELFSAALEEAEKKPTPLVSSAIAMLAPRFSDPNDAPGAMAQARSVIAGAKDAPREAAWPDAVSPSAL